MLNLSPITIGDARKYVEREHSHHHAPLSALCAVSVVDGGGLIVCVSMLGRPVSRELQAQGCVEVHRVASDGTAPHAASMAIGAIARAAIALGWRRLVSYTLLGEAGTSYRAAGWCPVSVSRDGREWSCVSRERGAVGQPGAKVRWEVGPDAMPRCAEVDAMVRESVGKIALPKRSERMPLFATADGGSR